MTASPFEWPALQPTAQGVPPPAASLVYERAVWGKVHGASSDFRWIARSAGFSRFDQALERQLSVGVEDEPHRAVFWRALPDACCAVGIYPSRSTDAVGRGGSLIEKQILAWPRADDLPAALGALLLLPHVATLTDDVWWPRRSDQPWSERDFSLPIEAADHRSLTASEEHLAKAIERGVEQLEEAGLAASLPALYAQLLSGREPAWLSDLERPLPPEAVAALLLPLPRSRADRLSIAGWVPSSRVDHDHLAGRWQILVEPAGRSFVPEDESPVDTSEAARFLAQALLAGDPSLAAFVIRNNESFAAAEEAALTAVAERPPERPAGADAPTHRAAPPDVAAPVGREAPAGHRAPAGRAAPAGTWDPFGDHPMRPGVALPLEEPGPQAAWVLRALHAFARNSDRRWLTPGALTREHYCDPLRSGSPGADLLLSWIQGVATYQPVYADADQWVVKVDLLRAAALALVPASPTLEAAGKLASGAVPPLLFGGILEPRQRDQFAVFEDDLPRLLDESLDCTSDSLREEVKRWLKEWRHHSGERKLRDLVTQMLGRFRSG